MKNKILIMKSIVIFFILMILVLSNVIGKLSTIPYICINIFGLLLGYAFGTYFDQDIEYSRMQVLLYWLNVISISIMMIILTIFPVVFSQPWHHPPFAVLFLGTIYFGGSITRLKRILHNQKRI